MSRKTSYYERFMAMTDAERDAEVAEFEKEFVGLRGRPLTAAQKALHRRAKKKVSRAAVSNGRRVVVTLEPKLVARADAFAKARGTSRSRLIAQGLEAVIGKG